MKTLMIAALATFALTTAAEANGKTTKRVVVSREVVSVYEPRPAPPLIALQFLGQGLVISDDLDIDLFDVEERRRQLRQRDFDRRRFSRERRYRDRR